jgi:hypothetical protein
MAIGGLMMIKMGKSAGSSKKSQIKKDNGIPMVSTYGEHIEMVEAGCGPGYSVLPLPNGSPE